MTPAIRRSASVFGSFIAIGLFFANLHAATVEKVNASYGAISGSMLPIWVAKEGRLFDKQPGFESCIYLRWAAQHHVVDRRQRTVR